MDDTAARYQCVLASLDPQKHRRTFHDLHAYCARDTLALAQLRTVLTSV